MDVQRSSVAVRRQETSKSSINGNSAVVADNDSNTEKRPQVQSSAVTLSSSRSNSGLVSGLKSVDYILKFILVGDSGVGKSCVLHRFIENKFNASLTHTIGVEFGCKTIQVCGKHVSLQVWDTAGQERYRCVTRSYYRGAVGALIVYDVTNRQSFENVVRWLSEARLYSCRDIMAICIGNKSDLKNMRRVSFMEASRFAMDNNILFLETSAMSGDGVDRAFVKVISSIISGISEGSVDSTDLLPGKSVYMTGGRAVFKEHTNSSSGSCLC